MVGELTGFKAYGERTRKRKGESERENGAIERAWHAVNRVPWFVRQTEILECFIDNYASIICVSFVILWTPIYDDCRCEFAAPFSNHFIAMILWCQSKSYTHLKMYDCDSVMIFIVYTFQAIQFKHFQTGQRMNVQFIEWNPTRFVVNIRSRMS